VSGYPFVHGIIEHAGRIRSQCSESIEVRHEVVLDVLDETEVLFRVHCIDEVCRQQDQWTGLSDESEGSRELFAGVNKT
jgi:hypothetical protein